MEAKLQTTEQTTKPMVFTTTVFERELQCLNDEGLHFSEVSRSGDLIHIAIEVRDGSEYTRFASAMKMFGFRQGQESVMQNLHSLKLIA
jgi:hypothetical protein